MKNDNDTNGDRTRDLTTLASTRLRLPEDDAFALKHVGVLTIYKILLVNVYIVHLLGWKINCTKFMVCTSKYYLDLS